MQGCIPVFVGGAGVAVAMTADRRSSGAYVDDEGIEWKAGTWINDRLGDKVHVNRHLLQPQAAHRRSLQRGAARRPDASRPCRKCPRSQNELRVAPTSTLSARTNDTYISSKVKARFRRPEGSFHLPT